MWMLWASASMDGLLTPKEKDQLIAADPRQAASRRRLEPGFAWCLCPQGREGPVATPDGYATGLILHALQVAGLPKENPQVSKGLAWLRSNQDPTGAWRAASVNKNRVTRVEGCGKGPHRKVHVGCGDGVFSAGASH